MDLERDPVGDLVVDLEGDLEGDLVVELESQVGCNWAMLQKLVKC